MSEVNHILVKLMANQGITQLELSKKTGIPTSAINRYVKDNSDMSASRVKIIARAMSVSADQLLGIEPLNDPRKDEIGRAYDALDERGKETLRRIAETMVQMVWER